MNTINLIKGFCFTILGYLGIETALYTRFINIDVGYLSWVLKYIPHAFIMIGTFKFYQFLRLKFKAHHEKVKSKF